MSSSSLFNRRHQCRRMRIASQRLRTGQSFLAGQLFLLLSMALLCPGNKAFSQNTGDDPAFRCLDPDANVIVHINLPIILSKVSLDDIAAPISHIAHMDVKNLLQNIAQTGLDLKRSLYVSTTIRANYTDRYVSFILPLSDSGKFISFVQQKVPDLQIIPLPGKARSAGDKTIGVAWNDQLATITISLGTPTDSSYATQTAKRSMRLLEGYNNSFYTSDPTFRQLFSDGGDIHIMSAEDNPLSLFTKMFGKTGALSNIQSLIVLRKRSFTSLSFGTGRISGRNITVVPPDTIALYKALNTRPLNTDLVARIPGKMLGFANFHFDPAALISLLDQFHYRTMLDTSLAPLGLSVNDFAKAIKGDFMVAATMPANLAAPTSSNPPSKMPDFFYVVTINDPIALFNINNKLKLLKDSGAYTLKDNILVVSNTKQLADSYFSAERRNTGFVTDKMKKSPVGVVLNMGLISDFLRTTAPTESESHLHFLDTLKKIDRVSLSSGLLENNNEIETALDIELVDKSTNSLRAFLQLLNHP